MKSNETLSEWRQAGLWDSASRSAAMAADTTNLIADVCSSFTSMLDWRSAAWLEDGGRKFVLTENTGTGQDGCHIELRASPTDDELEVRGGFYDTCQRPVVVRDQCLPLSWANRQKVAELLTETLVSLRRHRDTYRGSDSALMWFE